MSYKGDYIKRQIDFNFVKSPLQSNLDANGFIIYNLGTPSNPNDSVRYIDISGFIKSPLEYNLDANGKKIINLAQPTNPNDAARLIDISGGGGANVWYLYPAFTDVSFNNNSLLDISSILFSDNTIISSSTNIFSINSTNPIIFNNNQLVVSNSGNIGINNSTPNHSLDISGDVKFLYLYDYLDTSGSSGQILSSSPSGIKWIDPVDISDNTWIPVSNNIYNSNLTGNVGIGITNPIYKLDISGSIHSYSNIIVDGSANIGNILYVNNNSNKVGINNSLPSYT
jgi:hypothetical protein